MRISVKSWLVIGALVFQVAVSRAQELPKLKLPEKVPETPATLRPPENVTVMPPTTLTRPPASPAVTNLSPPSPPAVSPPPANVFNESVELIPYTKPRIWLQFDYLLWHINAGPAPVPLLTVNANPNSGAALNEPGTRILVGGSSDNQFDFGFQHGIRWQLGAFFDEEGSVGIETTGFLFEGDTAGYKAQTPGGNAPILGIPLFAVAPFGNNPAGETALNNGGFGSTVRIRSSTDSWSNEVNMLLMPDPEGDVLFGFLVGGRYLNLHERLELSNAFIGPDNVGVMTVRDHFTTNNHFGGINLGTRVQWNRGPWEMTINGKVALGVVHQRASIRGETVFNGAAFGLGNFVFPGGAFAQTSNTGNFSDNRFGILPEVNFKLAYHITPRLHVSVGYDALFLNSVLRPGNLIDRQVNVNQSALFGNGGPINPARPGVTMNDSSLWMHGVSFGLAFTY